MPNDATALQLVLSGDPALFAIVRLSLYVSLSAVVLAALIGIPLGAWIALTKLPGRQGVIVLLNALMGLPPVVVGLAVYLALSRSGPLGSFGLLFTPRAMIIAQAALITPIVIVGGNIEGFTRTMTTAIALETSKGDLPLAVGLGLVLIAIVIAVNALAWTARRAGERLAG